MSKWHKSITFNCDCESCNYFGYKNISTIILRCNCSIDHYDLFIKWHQNDEFSTLGALTDNGINALRTLLNYTGDEGTEVLTEDIQEIKNIS